MLNRLILLSLIIILPLMPQAFGANLIKESSQNPANNDEKLNKKNLSDKKIAVVDVQTILDLSTAVTGIRISIEKLSQDLQKDFSNRELELKDIESKLIEKQETLSKENFEKEVLVFNKKVTEVQKIVQEKKIRLEQAHSKAISKVNGVAMKIIKDLAQKRHFSVVFPSTQVLYADEALNITEEVLIKLNNTIPSVEVKF